MIHSGDNQPPESLIGAIASRRLAARTAAVCLLLWFIPVLVVWLLLGRQRAVQDLRWLTPGEMRDGLALAETTPALSSWCFSS